MGMGGGGSAEREARRAESARLEQVRQGTDAVNAVFDAPRRQAQYGELLTALRERGQDDLNEQKRIADLQRTFSIGRSGLTGASQDASSRKLLGREYTKGLLDLEGRAQGAASDLRMQDEQDRLNLLQMIQAGLDTGTASQRAGAAMRASAQNAMSGALAAGAQDIFSGSLDIAAKRKDASDRRRGIADTYSEIYRPMV